MGNKQNTNKNQQLKDNNLNNKNKVVVIGVGGSSASGKSSIANIISKYFNSPIITIEGDWFFKTEIPYHDKYEENWEIPEAMNLIKFKEAIITLKNLIPKCADFNTNFEVDVSERGINKIKVNNKDYKNKSLNKDDHIIIVVESFLLYYDKDISNLIDIPIFMESDKDICRERRLKRDSYATKDYYDELVWVYYLKFKDLQLNNANPKIFDGSKQIDKLSEEVLLYISQKLTN